MQMLFYEPRLGKVGNGWCVTKVSRIMVPIVTLRSPSGLQSGAGHHLPCATSQMRTPYWGNLKNLAFAIEPPANPMRPTFRDGH